MSSILIVDDMKMMNNALKKVLEEDSHEVTQVFTLSAALEEIKVQVFDYILLDLILPDGDGESLLPFVQKTSTSVIVLTTDRDSFRRDSIFNFGVVDYILKDKVFNNIVNDIKELLVKVESNKKFTVLIVDDSYFIRNHISQMLSKRGINIVTAVNGKEALSILLSRKKIDAAIVDLEMPEMDGLTLLGKVKKSIHLQHIPIMILTGSNDSNTIAKVIKNGVYDLIKKPFITEELLLKIDNMFSRMKQDSDMLEEKFHFGMYYDAIKTSTLFLKLSADMEITYINQHLKDMLHITDMSSSLENILSSSDHKSISKIRKAAHDNENLDIELSLTTDNKLRGVISAIFSPIVSTEDEVQEIVMIAHDITKLHTKIDAQELVNAEQQALMFQQAKMASMGEMIGNIAHQWRQPLNYLGLLVQDLEDAYQYGEINEKYIESHIEKSMHQVNFMSKTIDDFRNFFQPTKQKENFEVVSAMKEVLEIVGQSLAEKSIEVKITSSDDSEVHYYGYKNELQQVILNLINNAKDAIIEKNPTEKFIDISITKNDALHTIICKDSAGGIPKEILSRVFEPYFTTKEEGKGSGIGLYMSKMIIEQSMGGTLSVYNDSEGAVFQISFSV